MIKQNKVLLKEKQLDYIGNSEDNQNYETISQFLEALYIEGICDEIELSAYENLSYTGRCTPEEFEYATESITLWNEDEYFRRLNEISNY